MQIKRYHEDPALANVDSAVLSDYVGTYELAPGNQMMVTTHDGQLYAQRGIDPPVELVSKSPDTFFRKGIEGRRLFHRDPSGKVDLLIDRRNNEDMFWQKIN